MKIIKRISSTTLTKVFVEQSPQKRTIFNFKGKKQFRIFPYTLFEITYNKLLYLKTFESLRFFMANETINDNTLLMTPNLGGVFMNGRVCMPYTRIPIFSFKESKIINKTIANFWNSRFNSDLLMLDKYPDDEWKELTQKNKIPKLQTHLPFQNICYILS